MANVQNPTTWVNQALHYVGESVHANEVDRDLDRANVFAAQALVYATLATTGIQIASNAPAEGTVELPPRQVKTV